MPEHRVRLTRLTAASRTSRNALVALVAVTMLALALPLASPSAGAAEPAAGSTPDGQQAGPAAADPAAPPVPPAPGKSHTVKWDDQSMIIDGKRTFLWSGEIHPFRIPSPSLWRDILQKMKSNGYNSVGIYVHWGFESPKQGVYDWTGVRDLDKFLDMAEEVGLYVIARPGPYINAETDGGGFPGWLKATPGRARTDNATYLEHASEYQAQVDKILAKHQLTDGGGSVVLYQIENEYANNINSGSETETTGSRYMKRLYQNARDNGITVPIFHNDKGRNGFWRPGDFPTPENENPPNYLYGFDGYPAGVCSTNGSPGTPGPPPDWGDFGPGGRTGGATASPNTPGLLAEFGGGWFDPWGDRLWNGAGYECMRKRQSAAMERQYYLTNVANGIKIHNVYMTYGGTSWGWIPAPLVYTSYDYGAAFDEARQQTSKVPTMKELGYFLQSVPSVNEMVTADPAPASDPAVKSYHTKQPDRRHALLLLPHRLPVGRPAVHLPGRDARRQLHRAAERDRPAQGRRHEGAAGRLRPRRAARRLLDVRADDPRRQPERQRPRALPHPRRAGRRDGPAVREQADSRDPLRHGAAGHLGRGQGRPPAQLHR